MNVRLALLAVLLVPLLCAPARAAKIQPADSTYELSHGVLTLGTARFRLSPHGEDGCWRYEYQAQPSGVARLFIGNVSERSEFCVVDGELRSRYFEFKRADEAEKDFSLHFNWKDGVVRSSSGELRQLVQGMTDRLTMQILVQNWVIDRNGEPGDEELSIVKVDEDRIRTNRFRIAAREKVSTPAGDFDTVRVDRVDDKKRATHFWLAPARGYTAVQVQQTKKGSEELRMELLQK